MSVQDANSNANDQVEKKTEKSNTINDDLFFDALFNDEFHLVSQQASHEQYNVAIQKAKIPNEWIPNRHQMSEEELAIALWDISRGFMRVVPGTCE